MRMTCFSISAATMALASGMVLSVRAEDEGDSEGESKEKVPKLTLCWSIFLIILALVVVTIAFDKVDYFGSAPL